MTLSRFKMLVALTCLITLYPAIRASSQTIRWDKRSPDEQRAESKYVPPVNPYEFRGNRNSRPTRHWIIFAANHAGRPATDQPGVSPSLTGHIFVIFGIEDPQTDSSRMEAFGFYPADKGFLSEVKSVTSSTPGSIEDNLDGVHEGAWEPTETEMLVVEVPSADYDRAREEVGVHQSGAIPQSQNQFMNYSIPNSDCVTFVDWVAGGIGLKRPVINFATAMPIDYLHAIMALNVNGPSDPADYSVTSTPRILTQIGSRQFRLSITVRSISTGCQTELGVFPILKADQPYRGACGMGTPRVLWR
jgi:hypothetical protein